MSPLASWPAPHSRVLASQPGSPSPSPPLTPPGPGAWDPRPSHAPTTRMRRVAVSFMFSICTVSSYSPESERAAWRTKNTVSVSLVRTFTREASTGAPPFVHTTWGRGFPWVGSRGQRSAGALLGNGPLTPDPDPDPDPRHAPGRG